MSTSEFEQLRSKGYSVVDAASDVPVAAGSLLLGRIWALDPLSSAFALCACSLLFIDNPGRGILEPPNLVYQLNKPS
jgi:hypothetical protein